MENEIKKKSFREQLLDPNLQNSKHNVFKYAIFSKTERYYIKREEFKIILTENAIFNYIIVEYYLIVIREYTKWKTRNRYVTKYRIVVVR